MGTRGRDSGGESCSMRLAGGGKVGAGVAERDRGSPTLSDVWPNLGFHRRHGPPGWPRVHKVNGTH